MQMWIIDERLSFLSGLLHLSWSQLFFAHSEKGVVFGVVPENSHARHLLVKRTHIVHLRFMLFLCQVCHNPSNVIIFVCKLVPRQYRICRYFPICKDTIFLQNKQPFGDFFPRKAVHCIIKKLPLPLYHNHDEDYFLSKESHGIYNSHRQYWGTFDKQFSLICKKLSSDFRKTHNISEGTPTPHKRSSEPTARLQKQQRAPLKNRGCPFKMNKKIRRLPYHHHLAGGVIPDLDEVGTGCRHGEP